MCEGNGENFNKYTRVKTKATTLNYLNHIGVNVVELAHNHIYDTLLDGFENTIAFLDKNNIKHIGASTNPDKASEPLIITDNNSSVCILNYVHPDTNPGIPEDVGVYANIFDYQKVKQEIQHYRLAHKTIIVLLHWGGRTEGGKLPDFYQPTLAHRLIDDGADIIIGTHSHAIQPYEIYKGKYIFYGLGNFCFSRIGYKTPNKDAKMFWMCKSLIPIVSINNNQISVDIYKTDILKDGIITFSKYRKGKASKLFNLVFTKHQVWKLYWLFFKYIRPIGVFLFTDTMTFGQKASKIGEKFGLNKKH